MARSVRDKHDGRRQTAEAWLSPPSTLSSGDSQCLLDLRDRSGVAVGYEHLVRCSEPVQQLSLLTGLVPGTLPARLRSRYSCVGPRTQETFMSRQADGETVGVSHTSDVDGEFCSVTRGLRSALPLVWRRQASPCMCACKDWEVTHYTLAPFERSQATIATAKTKSSHDTLELSLCYPSAFEVSEPEASACPTALPMCGGRVLLLSCQFWKAAALILGFLGLDISGL